LLTDKLTNELGQKHYLFGGGKNTCTMQCQHALNIHTAYNHHLCSE